jgi:hypothetical protein
VRGGLLRTRGTYRHPCAWLGTGAGGQKPIVRGARAESGQCAAERLSTRSNTWRFVSTLVQMPVGRPKLAYLANDPVYRLFIVPRALCLV